MVKPLTGQSVVAVYASTADVWTLAKLPDTGQTGIFAPYAGYLMDADYTINPPSYTDNGNGTVTDNVTTLIWQQQDDDVGRTWDEAKTYCDSLELAGYTDWRLPSIMEIYSIMNYGTYNPAIDSTYFPNTQPSDPNIDADFWSSTPMAGDDSQARAAGFGNANTFDMAPGYEKKSDTNYARCVRGGTAFSGKVFTDNGNGTVTDNRTRLMWRQGETDGMAGTRDRQLSTCENLILAGYSDWRLPNIRELFSIMDFSKSSGPWIDTRYFPRTDDGAGVYASSSDPPNVKNQYFGVRFGSRDYNGSTFLRCVRGDGQ
ncbi:MAG: DUF1566 domain-containing protein [Nitrospinae bacterium]|nr:DUF1566 domain-containing protein [Nitrospinota bacterium]